MVNVWVVNVLQSVSSGLESKDEGQKFHESTIQPHISDSNKGTILCGVNQVLLTTFAAARLNMFSTSHTNMARRA